MLAKKLLTLQTCTLFCCLLLAQISFMQVAEAKTDTKDEAPVIVLAGFGTTVEQKSNFWKNMEGQVKKKYPKSRVLFAYTSRHVANTLEANGALAPMLPQVLALLSREGVDKVLVQSLHLIPGKEFHDVYSISKRFIGMPKGIKQVEVGLPLLAEEEDIYAVAKTLRGVTPKERKENDAIVLVGHGTHGPGSITYAALQGALWADDPLFFVGTIEGLIGVEQIVLQLKAKGVQNVWLMPLLGNLGDHAQNDIFGEEDDSWLSSLKKAGFTVSAYKKSLYEFPEISDFYLQHIDNAMKRFRK